MTKNDIIKFISEHRQELNYRFGLTKIGLFGSYAKGTATEDSDIDFVIETTNKNFFLRMELKNYLESHFHKPVDIGYIDSFRSFFKKRIENDIIYV